MLIGVSLGPGDPGLITLKAVEVLRQSSKVFVPGEIAEDLARPYCTPQVLDFPMTEDRPKLEEVWAANADIVAGYAAKGLTAFACLGDVNTFSTFSHLQRLVLERHPEVQIESIPGVGVVSALASRFRVALDRSFVVCDGSEVEIAIRMKATRPRELSQELQAQGFEHFILGSNLCTPKEMIISEEMPERSGYFSVLFARKKGGRP